MKKILKSIVAYMLGLFARAVVHRYHPHIVMVTGSVGKTSTKDAVAAVLSSKYLVRKSKKSFNSEFGVPFTILGVDNPWGNSLAWLSIIKSAIALLVLPNHYPNMLVLEVGADRPGDLARILRMATPETVVVTRLPSIPVHVEAYASPEAVWEEEFLPACALAAGRPLIVPIDDPEALEMAKRTSARVHTYGVSKAADVSIDNGNFHEEKGVVVGMQTIVHVGGEQGRCLVTGSVGGTQLLPIAAAVAAASCYDIALSEALHSLTQYEPPPGRGRLLRGKDGSILIDDSYNASPIAVEESLKTLKAFPHAKRRIAVLGDMLELGRYSVTEHERIGTIARDSADIIVAVGVRSRAFAQVKGRAEVITFDNASAASAALLSVVSAGDVVLIKGSESMRLERIVETLLADPSDSTKLVRQEPAWKRKG